MRNVTMIWHFGGKQLQLATVIFTFLPLLYVASTNKRTHRKHSSTCATSASTCVVLFDFILKVWARCSLFALRGWARLTSWMHACANGAKKRQTVQMIMAAGHRDCTPNVNRDNVVSFLSILVVWTPVQGNGHRLRMNETHFLSSFLIFYFFFLFFLQCCVGAYMYGACVVGPGKQYIAEIFTNLVKEKVISSLCFISFHAAFQSTATCSINQGCQADIAGTQAALHWFSQGCRASAAGRCASKWSVVFLHYCWSAVGSYTFDCPEALISLVRQMSTLKRLCLFRVYLFERPCFFFFFREVWIGIKWCQHETKAWNI